jgi:hypothetical protein
MHRITSMRNTAASDCQRRGAALKPPTLFGPPVAASVHNASGAAVWEDDAAREGVTSLATQDRELTAITSGWPRRRPAAAASPDLAARRAEESCFDG